MATTNASMTQAWGKLVDAGVDFIVSFGLNDAQEGPLPKDYVIIEVAISATATNPTINNGRILVVGGNDKRNEGVTRAQLGSGYLYGRVVKSSYPMVAVIDYPS